MTAQIRAKAEVATVVPGPTVHGLDAAGGGTVGTRVVLSLVVPAPVLVGAFDEVGVSVGPGALSAGEMVFVVVDEAFIHPDGNMVAIVTLDDGVLIHYKSIMT